MRYLFIDDYRIAERRGFVRHLHRAQKREQPLVLQDCPWEYAAIYPKVIYHPGQGRFELWYYPWTPRPRASDCYATSSDGIHWEKPALGLKEHEGSTENNLIDSQAGFVAGILHTPEMLDKAGEPAEHLYKMLAWLNEENQYRGWIPLFSSDALRWKIAAGLDRPQGIAGPPEILGDTCTVAATCDCFPLDDPNLPSKYVAFPRYHVTVGRFQRRRAIGYSSSLLPPGQSTASEAFLEWTPPLPVLSPDFTDDLMTHERLDAARDVLTSDDPAERHCEFYGMTVHRYEELFLGLLWVFDISSGSHGLLHVQLAASRDLVHWERLGDRQPFIDRGQPGVWDSATVHFTSSPVLVGDEVRIYYTGSDWAHGTWSQRVHQRPPQKTNHGLGARRPAIGLATVPRDRFVSLDAGVTESYLRTRPFVLPAGQLHLNVDARDGQVLAMLCDTTGQPLLDWERVVAISSDQLDITVLWPADTLDKLRDQKVSLLIRARNASLFSYWFA